MLPLGLLRAATRPALTGSEPVLNTMGIVAVCLLGREHRVSGRGDHRRAATHEIGCQAGQPIELAACPAVLDRGIAAFGETGFVEPLRNAAARLALVSGELSMRNPITGVAVFCARAASGHAPAAPPSSDMNTRRLIIRSFWNLPLAVSHSA